MTAATARLRRGVERRVERVSRAALARGVPPSWLGYRWVEQDTVATYLDRLCRRGAADTGRIERIHPRSVADNPLPMNIDHPWQLSDDSNWWGYAMRDVPHRASGETFIATIPDCRLLFCTEPAKKNFQVAILNKDDRAIALREIAFRTGHGAVMRAGREPVRVPKATWILERVYHNHSHWLAAHLPKLVLLRDRGELGDVLLPRVRNDVMDSSLRMLGLDPGAFRTFDPDVPLDVGELTVLSTDRFRPELLQSVRDAIGHVPPEPPWRRIFISRARSKGRQLLNEDTLWPVLESLGFERMFMEELGFEEQLQLMGEAQVVLAPHGAGLTNILFCRPGTHVVEIADPGYPNPNFYALACAMDVHYWLVDGEAIGEGHPLDKDLRVETTRILDVLDALGMHQT